MKEPIFPTPKGELKEVWIATILGVRDLTIESWRQLGIKRNNNFKAAVKKSKKRLY